MKTLSKRTLQYIFLFALSFVTVLIWCEVFRNENKTLKVVFLNVGQGDAIYIEAPNGNQMLIDGGPSSGALLRELGNVMPFWDRSLDVVLVTHPDQDHTGGLPALFQNMNVRYVVTTENSSDTDVYRALQGEILAEKNVTRLLARRGGRVVLGDGVFLEVLFPDRETVGWEPNTSSVITKLSYGDTSFVFTGDAPQGAENYVIGTHGTSLKANVLKLGHHGSKTSSSEAFLSVVDPDYAIISAGLDNKYGHPNKEVLDVLGRMKIPTVSTVASGTVMFETNGKMLWAH